MALTVRGDELYDETGDVVLRKCDAPLTWGVLMRIIAAHSDAEGCDVRAIDEQDRPEDADEYRDLFQPVERPYRGVGLGMSGITRLSERLREHGIGCD